MNVTYVDDVHGEHKFRRVFVDGLRPCIRLARGKFELTNQDSAGGKKFTVLASM